MSDTSNSGGLCARFSPDCGSVFAEVNTLEQFSSKMAEPGCVPTRDTRRYCFALLSARYEHASCPEHL